MPLPLPNLMHLQDLNRTPHCKALQVGFIMYEVRVRSPCALRQVQIKITVFS